MSSLTPFGLALALVLAGAAPPQTIIRPLLVHWIDVEGGAATLIVTPAGESILSDTGNPGGRDAARIHKTATQAGLKRIDHVIVTHLHGDHFGGLTELAALMPIGTLYENGIDSAPEMERAQPTLEAYRHAKVARRVIVQPGDEIELAQTPGAAPLRVRVLAARQQFADASVRRPNEAVCRDRTDQPPDLTDNANSIVTLIESGPFRFFIGGDLTWNVEGRLVCPDDRVGPVDVYQSVHHGLDVSNSPVLVRTLQPRVVVFNNGVRKGFEKRSVATIKGTPSVEAIYQVHLSLREGAENTADERIANREEKCTGEGIAMSVDPSGQTYTISVPATGHRQTYQTRGKR